MISLTAPGFGGGSVNSGFINVMLTDPKERERSQQQIVDMVNRNLKKFPQGRAFAIAGTNDFCEQARWPAGSICNPE